MLFPFQDRAAYTKEKKKCYLSSTILLLRKSVVRQVVDASVTGAFSKSRITLTLQYDIILHRWDSVIVFHAYKHVGKYVSSLYLTACQYQLDTFFFLPEGRLEAGAF